MNQVVRNLVDDASEILNDKVTKPAVTVPAAYGFERKTILVLDWGASVCDVSVMEVGDSGIEVLSSSGDTDFGGDDFDNVGVETTGGGRRDGGCKVNLK